MSNLEKALQLVKIGLYVHPVQHKEDGTKVPLTKHGHLDASNDTAQVTEWFQTTYPKADVGVHVGRSGLVVLDRDMKVDENGEVVKDGFEELEGNWLFPTDTYNYTSVNGLGQHDIYLAPKNIVLSKSDDYRGMKGVDRWAGSAWLFWAGGVPKSRDEFAPAPEWLCDPSRIRTGNEFAGTVDEWLDELVPGEPNALVRRAISRVPEDDLTHQEMVSHQHHAIRLGAEGNSGATQFFDKIYDVWMNRPEEEHSTPKDKWDFKFNEALLRGIKEFGAQTDLMQNLPEFDIENLPAGVNSNLLVGKPQDNFHFSKVLNHLAELKVDKDVQASILWNAPTTRDVSRDWSLPFVYHRIEQAETTPEPERENPSLEIEDTFPSEYVTLLNQEERDYIAKRPTFVDRYIKLAKQSGIDNEVYLHDGAWSVASMAFAFKGFIPQSKDKRMGVNIWVISFGESGSGKTTALEFEETVLGTLFDLDNEDKAPYHTGADTSPQGLHSHLLERDRKPTLLLQDEAGTYFKAIQNKSWIEELTHYSSDWYNGRIRSTSKLSAKELRGKTALGSFNMRMFGTPGQVFPHVGDDLFESGFLARVLWSVAPPLTAEQKDRKYQKRQYIGKPGSGMDEVSDEVKEIAIDLISASRLVGDTPRPIVSGEEELHRMYIAHRKMGEYIEGHVKANILEPSVMRLGEDYMRKCASICAMYRGDTTINLADTLHAINAVEKWFNYLLEVVDSIQKGEFQQLCTDMETLIMTQKGVSESRILHTFQNRIKREPRELQSALDFIVRTGRVNRVEKAGRENQYEINGGKK